MKKIFTIIALFACSMAVMATDYTNTLTVSINGNDCEPQTAVISVNEQDNGKYTLQLKNFILSIAGSPMAVGNITLSDVEGTTTDGVTTLTSEQNAAITAGDLDGYNWIGGTTFLSSAPVVLNATIKDDKLTATIDINMGAVGLIKVTFGDTNTGISAVTGSTDNAKVVGIYELTGRRVTTMGRGKVYIVKYADGKAVKTVKK